METGKLKPPSGVVFLVLIIFSMSEFDRSIIIVLVDDMVMVIGDTFPLQEEPAVFKFDLVIVACVGLYKTENFSSYIPAIKVSFEFDF